MDEPDLSDRPADAALSAPELIGRGRYDYERYRVRFAGQDRGMTREVVRVGPVVVILPIDLARDEVVLIRQYRLGAQLALGQGDMVEVPAGHVEPGEEPAEAALRECREETGLTPQRLVPLFSLMPSAGMSDEHMSFFLALVDAGSLPARAGAPHENEETRPMRVPVDRALAALAAGQLHYGAAIAALQWLALNRARLPETARESGGAR
jgi:ADP-ribose pyrophosphatase